MKKCLYCGAEYPDEAVICAIDHMPFEEPMEPPRQDTQDFVTLVNCINLPAADVVVSRLKAAGIDAFIPDESVMQVMGGMNAVGYVRVQIAPRDYEAAKALLSDINEAVQD